jgi:hypothetical protein
MEANTSKITAAKPTKNRTKTARKPKNKTYVQQSDFKKGQWLSQRPRLQLALEQLAAYINHLHPPL